MGLKIYRSKRYMSLSIPLQVSDRRVIAEFKGGRVNPRTHGCFVTLDREIQDALEKSPAFGVCYVLEDTVESVKPECVVEDTKSDRQKETVEEITRVQDAAEYLCEKYNVLRADVNTKAKIRSFIAGKDLVFPNLNLGDGAE